MVLQLLTGDKISYSIVYKTLVYIHCKYIILNAICSQNCHIQICINIYAIELVIFCVIPLGNDDVTK